jgi:hypothetical protein
MALQFKKASRKQVKIKMQIGAPSGSGKTYGALKLAYGITGDWSKIAVIDTENDSSQLYVGKDGIGEFNVISLNSFSERDYINALELCEQNNMEVAIIDTSSRLWDYVLEYHGKLGGRFQDWAEPKAKHKKYLNKMLQSNMHIISTVRKKEEYVMEENERNGKKGTSIKKLGLKEQQEGNMNYEFTLVFDVDRDTHYTTTSKDRTGLFEGEDPFLITEETGKRIKEWCSEGNPNLEKELTLIDALDEIRETKDISELKEVLKKYLSLKDEEDFKIALKAQQLNFTTQK